MLNIASPCCLRMTVVMSRLLSCSLPTTDSMLPRLTMETPSPEHSPLKSNTSRLSRE